MEEKAVSGIMLTLILIGVTLTFNIHPAMASGTIYIGPDGSINPPTTPIQRDGDIYTFTDFIYDEIWVARSDIVIDGNGYGLQGTGAWYSFGILLLTTSNVTIKNTRISAFTYGINLQSSNNNTINGNNITANIDLGVYLYSSSGNNISGNNILANNAGIWLSSSSENSISGNEIANNGNGISLSSSNNNSISENNITANNWNGISLGYYSSGNNVSGNNITANNERGIYLNYADGNSISGNNITANNWNGILLNPSSYNNIYENDVAANGDGIALGWLSSDNNIFGNRIKANSHSGISLYAASNNVVYHNNFENNAAQVNIWEAGPVNVWDDGYPSGGNYWSDFIFRYPNALELDDSGIWDTPYVIDENNQDHYPLMEPWTPTPPKVTTLAAPYILDDNLVPGSIFRINITVADVQNLHGYQFVLSYDTNILTAIDYGLYLPFKNFLPSEINDEAGYVALAAYTYMGDWYGLTTIDPAPAAWIEFLVDDRGLSVLDVHGPFEYPYTGSWLPTSFLSNVYGEEIEHVDVDGFFDNRISAVTATPDIDPDTLNLRSKGQWITAYIQLPEGYDVANINATTILLNGTISPVLDPKYDFVTNSSEYLVDHNNDGILERIVKFDRATVESYIYRTQGISYGNVALTVTGELFDGTPFEGTDTIIVNYAGDANEDGTIDIVDVSVISAHWYPGPPIGPLGYGSKADFNKDGEVNIIDLGILSGNWGQTLP